ncbi:MAG: multiprotein bridging factor aMBF1 [Candidatus Woesearchaeota archaeon]
MQCDMCGSSGILYKTLIEGTQLNVCKNCAKYGKVVKKSYDPDKIKSDFKKSKKNIDQVENEEKEIIEYIVDDYSTLIKQKREKLGLKQNEFALKISEKESLIQNIERGNITPSLELAKKFERFLNIKLIDTYEEVRNTKKKVVKNTKLTIGDIINIKKK